MSAPKKAPKRTDPRVGIGPRLYAIDNRQEEIFGLLKSINLRLNGLNERMDTYNKRIDTLLTTHERTEQTYEGMYRRAVADAELIKEVNAHMWQTQNRLNAVRDILWKRDHKKAGRNLWTRIGATFARMKKKPSNP
jgi:hypothetical protein